MLLHEMIHYYIAYNNIQDTAPHGDVFKAMMNRLNREYGWNMKVSEGERLCRWRKSMFRNANIWC